MWCVLGNLSVLMCLCSQREVQRWGHWRQGTGDFGKEGIRSRGILGQGGQHVESRRKQADQMYSMQFGLLYTQVIIPTDSKISGY